VTPHTVRFKPSAAAAIRQLPRGIRERVVAKAESLAFDPRPPGVVKLAGNDLWRIRIADHRILYRIEDNILLVTIVRVGHRGHRVYDNLDTL
jgi:mRNA interferase RelE/StbE